MEKFDPAIHWSNPDGSPYLTKRGTFRKKGGRPKKPEEAPDGRTITDQLVKASLQYKMGKQKIDAVRAIADNVIKMAVEGDKWAIQFFAERTEGKARQQIDVTEDRTINVILNGYEKPQLKYEEEVVDQDMVELLESLQ